jgi:hypothetical protein
MSGRRCARAITDGTFDAWGKEGEALVQESIALVKGFLALDLSR